MDLEFNYGDNYLPLTAYLDGNIYNVNNIIL